MSTHFDTGVLHPYELTVEQYEAMLENGIIEEGAPIELLDGVLVRKDRSNVGGDPMTVGEAHAAAIRCLQDEIGTRLARSGCFLQTQLPIRIAPRNEPEPDGCIVAAKRKDYSRRHPGPEDACSVIEVSDSSLAVDRTTKLRVYAFAGIAQYVIVNLVDRQVEVFEKPMVGVGAYSETSIRKGNQAVSLRVAKGKPQAVKARLLLP